MAESSRSKILVTGATGFVGRRLITDLQREGDSVVGLARSGADFNVDLSASPDLAAALQSCMAVVHLASRVHVMNEVASDPLAEYRRANVEATRHLAKAAIAAGVSKFIFMSSIKVNGEQTNSAPFTENGAPAPRDPYGQSKLEAEMALRELAALHSHWQLVILRPPLVYGPGVKGNFAQLVNLVRRVPMLPLGACSRERSLIFVGNLTSAIERSLRPGVRGTFVISDGRAVSVSRLIFLISKALNKTVWIFPVPISLLKLVGALTARSAQVSRLVDPLLVDSSGFEKAASWQPPYSLEEGLAETVSAMKEST